MGHLSVFMPMLKSIVARGCLIRQLRSQHTIFAPATASGRAGIAVIRVSGDVAREIVVAMTRPSIIPPPRIMATRSIVHPTSNELLDKALVVHFQAPHSYTGEDVVEFHVHGGRAVVASILDALSTQPFCRMAEAGEFTHRAFINGKLDLTEVEGIADLINAETEVQRKQSLRQANGNLKILYKDWRTRLITALANIEAIIDFDEDEQVEDGLLNRINIQVNELQSSINHHLQDGHRGEILRQGVHTTIFGPPNAGKSSLLNYLTGHQSAIVSSTPGTTRDVIEKLIDIAGYPVIVGDTAGIRSEGSDSIELMGIQLTRDRLDMTDFKICVLEYPHLHISDDFKMYINSETVVIVNKVDDEYDLRNFPNLYAQQMIKDLNIPLKHILPISLKHKRGLNSLLQSLQEILHDRFDGSRKGMNTVIGQPVITQARHRACLLQCQKHLEQYHIVLLKQSSLSGNNFCGEEMNIVLAAEHLRQAANALGRITGAVDIDEVLDAVFSNFCIGK